MVSNLLEVAEHTQKIELKTQISARNTRFNKKLMIKKIVPNTCYWVAIAVLHSASQMDPLNSLILLQPLRKQIQPFLKNTRPGSHALA